MRFRICVAALATLIVCGPALAQSRSRANRRGTPRTLRRSTHKGRGVETRSRSRRSGTTRFQQPRGINGIQPARGLITRPQRIRNEFPFERQDYGLLQPPPRLAEIVSRSLNARNLLRSRSVLAKKSMALVGRLDPTIGTSPIPAAPPQVLQSVAGETSYAGGLARAGPKYSELLRSRLEAKADEYFDLGLAYFREGQYLKSRHYFDLVRQLERHRTRAFTANVIVSYQRQDINTAILSLLRAFQRAQTLDDLKLDRQAFYPEQLDFQQVVDAVNLFAKSVGAQPESSLLLAYYAWLNGDLNTAQSAARTAVNGIEARFAKMESTGVDTDETHPARSAKRFLDLLDEAKRARKRNSAARG